MTQLDDDDRELLAAYANASRPKPAAIEHALTRALAGIDCERPHRELPDARRRYVWTVVAGLAVLALATVALAGYRWIRTQPQVDELEIDEGSDQAHVEVQADRIAPVVATAEPEPEPEPEPERELAAAELEVPAPEPSDGATSPAHRQRPHARRSPETATPSQPPVAPVDADSLADESRLLGRARKALDAGNYGVALDWVDEHAHAHLHGALEEERLILEAAAACRGGDARRGRAALSKLRTHFSDSPALAKIESSCSE